MDILQNNPYRLLGVYANSPTKERLANLNRMKAFLKVGRQVSFPLDLSEDFLPVNRTESVVADADAKLTLPKDQILYAQFWFVKTTPLDDVAFNHLVAGEIDKAEEIWQKRESASSLQNRIVCALMREDYACAIICAEILYGNSQYVGQLVTAVVGTGGNFDASSLAFSFLDVLCEEIGAGKLLPFTTNATWEDYIKEKTVKPIIAHIQDAIDVAKKSKGKGAAARYEAGKVLMEETKQPTSQLRILLSSSEIQYQTIVDKLGLEILQCGIDYFNDSEEPDAAKNAMVLQRYAKSIVVGQMAKDRCKENVDILQKIIDNLPPLEVFAEDRAIRKELHKYSSLPDKISYAIELLNNTKPLLQTIKEKIGRNSGYYLKISTLVVSNALSNVIAEVNQAQNYISVLHDKGIDGRMLAIMEQINGTSFDTLEKLKADLVKAANDAWRATKLMDSFDKETDFKSRYDQNRQTLKRLCESLGISTLSRRSFSQALKKNELFIKLVFSIIGGVLGYIFAITDGFRSNHGDIPVGIGVLVAIMGALYGFYIGKKIVEH